MGSVRTPSSAVNLASKGTVPNASKEALSAYDAVSSIPVRLISVDIQQALKLALDYNIYAYDAYFLQYAKQLSSPLITLDKRMKKIARDLNIEIVE
ncbi:MAG: type II toxin-antitoxin system VapC family toxin [Gammaproteobacteria bacterium]|nr:type II toxin-antitoxin system VapC family toxin [Gammaproteobacteria bacterium]